MGARRDDAAIRLRARWIFHESSFRSPGSLSDTASLTSETGDAITYAPLAHLPRSMVRHRSLQKGNSASVLFTAFLQIGQRSLTSRLRGIQNLIVEGKTPDCRLKRRWAPKALHDLRHKIVVMRLRDLATIELAWLRLHFFGNVVHEDFAVDLGCVHRRSSL
jgi:hypothetical protein